MEDIRVLVFVSPKCSHCPAAEALVKRIAPEYQNQGLSYQKIRTKTSEGKKLSQEYNVLATPTILFLDKSGKEIKRIVGVPSENNLRGDIESALGIKKSFFSKIFGKT